MNSATHSIELNKALIVGLGKTGLSCARYLQQQGVDFAFADSREAPASLVEAKAQFPHADMLLGEFTASMLDGVQMLVLSPGVDPRNAVIQSAYQRGLDVVGDIELFARAVQQPVVAITGSNGKSTVTELLGAMAREAKIKVAVGGNVGTPALDLLQQDVQLFVMELSSFQLETVRSLEAKAAVVLNVSEDHMDRYDSYTDYSQSKAVVYQNSAASIVNEDDALVADMPVQGEVKHFTVAAEPRSGQYGLGFRGAEQWLVHGSEYLLPVREMKLQGSHNYANALAALALADAIELPRAAALQALRDFSGLEHRSQWVAEKNTVAYINDSKATNVGATVAAINGMQQKQVLIAGGVGKEQDFSPLREPIAQRVRHLVLLGRDADMLEQAVGTACPVSHAESMQDAVVLASNFAKPGDAVVLSPACASFDMYKGFEERGYDFVCCVQNLLCAREEKV